MLGYDLNACTQDVARVARLGFASSVLAVGISTAIAAMAVPRGPTGKDKRAIFHAARATPWAFLIVLVVFGIVTNVIDKQPVDEYVTLCIPPHVMMGMCFFCTLLLNDLIWLGAIFRSLHKKPFLLLHHLIYLAWAVLTIAGMFEYVRLIFLVAALEESQEALASISYLRKDQRSGRWWLFFCIAWRMMCSSFAVGVMSLWLMLGTGVLSWAMLTFMTIEILLWVFFLWQEWSFLAEMVLNSEEEEKTSHMESQSHRQSAAAGVDEDQPMRLGSLARSTTLASMA